jgi:hypothetical protein
MNPSSWLLFYWYPNKHSSQINFWNLRLIFLFSFSVSSVLSCVLILSGNHLIFIITNFNPVLQWLSNQRGTATTIRCPEASAWAAGGTSSRSFTDAHCYFIYVNIGLFFLYARKKNPPRAKPRGERTKSSRNREKQTKQETKRIYKTIYQSPWEAPAPAPCNLDIQDQDDQTFKFYVPIITIFT